MSPIPTSHYTSVRNYHVQQGCSGELIPHSARWCCMWGSCYFQTVFLASFCPSYCFTLTTDVLWKIMPCYVEMVHDKQQLDFWSTGILASQNLSIFCSPVLSFFSKQYYWPNFVERQRFCNHLVPLLNSTTSLAFNSAEVRVVNGLQPGKISSRVEQKHLPETVPSPD